MATTTEELRKIAEQEPENQELETQETEESTKESTEQGTEETQEYTPNYSFNVKGVNYEFDEQLRAIVKDEETEKYVRDISERSKGLDHLKEHRDTLISENKNYRTQLQEEKKYRQHLEYADTLKDSGDILAALRHLGFKDEELLSAGYILAEDDPVKKRAYEAESRARVESIRNNTEKENYQSKLVDLELELLKTTINNEILKPGIKEVADEVDARNGKGFFAKEIINQGMNNERIGLKRNKDFTDAEVIEAVVNKYKPFITLQSTSAPAGTQKIQDKIVEPTQKQSIPSPRSSGSPARRKYTSTADLKAKYKELSEAV